ncbi:hypothetical protein G6F32_016919 [Rhizopus arrhizus]|nr:hypothetical protein G6F32_016919 [Rhizopus arrhizus]
MSCLTLPPSRACASPIASSRRRQKAADCCRLCAITASASTPDSSASCPSRSKAAPAPSGVSDAASSKAYQGWPKPGSGWGCSGTWLATRSSTG